MLGEAAPTMVLVEVDLGAERGLDFIARARKQGFCGPILVLTGGVSGNEAVHLIQAGVAGIVKKQQSAAFLCDTIRQVAKGEVYLEQDYLKPLFSALDNSRPRSRTRLTEHDKIVLRLVCQGLTNKDIGGRLGISESGAKSAVSQLFDKLLVRTRAQLVKAGLEQYGGDL